DRMRPKRMTNGPGSWETIAAASSTRATPHPNPPPQGGREPETPSPLVGEGRGGGAGLRPGRRPKGWSLLSLGLLIGVGAAGPARAAGPADPLLRLVPPDAGLTVAVEDLRGQARAAFESPLYDGLLHLPAVQAWLGSDRGRGYQKAKAKIGAILGEDFGAVRDGLLGEAFARARGPPPGGRPEDARGLLLVRVPDRPLLDRAVDALNNAQLKKGELARVAPKARDGAGYFAREFQAPGRPGEFYAHLPDRV